MPVNARKLVRKMRGGAQSHLIEADDGRFYIVKFQNNPQHRRILVNEWIASRFLEYLHIAVPATAIVNLSEEFLAAILKRFLRHRSKRHPRFILIDQGSRARYASKC